MVKFHRKVINWYSIYYSVGVWAQVNDVAVDQFNQCIEGKIDFDSAIETISQQGQEIFDANRME